MEQYLALSRENQAPGKVKPEIGGNVNFEINTSLAYSIFPESLKTQSCSKFFPLLLPDLQKGGWTNSPQELSIPGISSKRPLSKDNLGGDTKKLKENVHAIQVGCKIFKGPHLNKDCPINEEVKQVEEVRYREFGRTSPFNGNNRGKFHVRPPGYYTKTDNRPPYDERKQSLEELLAKHQEESARRSTKMEV
ncbi:hypothetical protein Tco_1540934 [Tanacetum coccineum]